MEGDIEPHNCEYYGEPNGCNSPIYGEHPTAENSSAIGNAAKLREAVKAVVDVGYPHNFQKEAPHIRGYCYDITRAIEKCFAALAAPPRNCDVGTAEEQTHRFDRHCDKYLLDRDEDEECVGCPLVNMAGHCELNWAQMPYESEAAK